MHLEAAALAITIDEFKVEVLSDSMREVARAGQFLRVSATQAIRDGDLVIADLSDEGDGEWVFKRYELPVRHQQQPAASGTGGAVP